MKIGIITEYSRNTLNYGNILQTYALNHYLKNTYPNCEVQTVLFNDDVPFGWRSVSTLKAFGSNVVRRIRKVGKKHPESSLEINKSDFQIFADSNISFSKQVSSEKELSQLKYDVLIVGSDVVWAQVDGYINVVKFLAFKGSENSTKLSYAASFGGNYVPACNKKLIHKYLSRFRGISVREKSSIALLDEVGVHDAVHVADPTLLITKEEWRKLEEKPNFDGVQSGHYILLYRIVPADWQKEVVKKIQEHFCHRILELNEMVSIDTKQPELITPQKWLWLIDNASIVITDSFHCMIFSAIFNKPFFITEREYKNDINNRMIDFLELINHPQLFIGKESEVKRLDQYKWDYFTIEEKIRGLISQSTDYINRMINTKDEYHNG